MVRAKSTAGATTLLPGASSELGDLFTGSTQDLAFRFLQAGTATPTIGAVIYQAITPDLPGDYNRDGTVDAADYTLWRNNFGSGASLPNDDTPGVGQDDYTRWKTHFGETLNSGPGSGANAAVPEPAALFLFAFGLGMLLLVPRRG